MCVWGGGLEGNQVEVRSRDAQLDLPSPRTALLKWPIHLPMWPIHLLMCSFLVPIIERLSLGGFSLNSLEAGSRPLSLPLWGVLVRVQYQEEVRGGNALLGMRSAAQQVPS